MPGMNSGLNPANPILVSAFRSALVHQWAIVALIFALLLFIAGYLALPLPQAAPAFSVPPAEEAGAPVTTVTPALAVSGGKLTVWRLAAAAAGWSQTQTINVPIQYGSSG